MRDTCSRNQTYGTLKQHSEKDAVENKVFTTEFVGLLEVVAANSKLDDQACYQLLRGETRFISDGLNILKAGTVKGRNIRDDQAQETAGSRPFRFLPDSGLVTRHHPSEALATIGISTRHCRRSSGSWASW